MVLMILLSFLILYFLSFSFIYAKIKVRGDTMFVDFDIQPTKLISSYRLLSSPVNVLTRQAGRKHWGILLKTQGQTYYDQNGQKFLSDKNHVMLMPKGAQYTWTCAQQGECIIIDFDAPVESQAIQSIEVSDSSYICTAFAKIERSMNLNTPVGRLEAMHQLYGILVFLAKAANKKYISRDRQHILKPAINYMLEQYADPAITNTFLSGLCGISTVYFRKTFEAIYGISPIRYLHQLRIAKAKAILQGDYDSIGQVSQSVGYNSVYHFSKMFKAYTGMSPTDYTHLGSSPHSGSVKQK